MSRYRIGTLHHHHLSDDSIGKTRESQEDAPNIHKPLGYGWAVRGAEVQLKNNADYIPHPNNPVQGSKYACRGAISALRDTSDSGLDARPVSVGWSNGRSNQYFFEDLELYDKDLELYDNSLWGEIADLPEEKKGKLFNERDIVFLRPGFKTAGHEHPALGTAYQCPGTVENAKHDNIGVRLAVKWYNSLKSEYSIQYDTEKNPSKSPLINAENQEELKQFVKENPNFAYRLSKDTQDRDHFGVFGFFRVVMGIEEKLPVEKPKAELVDLAAEYVSVDLESSDTIADWHESVVVPSEEYNEDGSNR